MRPLPAREGREEPSFGLGFLAAVPLALFYEWSVARHGGSVRNSAERVLSLPLDPLGPAADLIRPLVLLLCTLAALVVARRFALMHGRPLAALVLRQPVEGFVGALLLGPALIVSQRIFDSASSPLGYAASAGLAPSLETGALVAGGAFHEELVFRVGALALAFIGWRALIGFFGSPTRASALAAEALAIVTAAGLFAAFHLDALSHWVGVRGESFDRSTFVWRFLGGCLLGALVRWRGFGVVAWTHAFFNLALLLGAGPRELH